jgi:Rrf2 family protein
MISKKTKYALRALSYLAQQTDNRPVLIADLAQSAKVPRKFLEFILLSLRKGGLLVSRIGKGGGYRLAHKPSEITIASVVRILEGGFSLVHCLNDNGVNSCEEGNDPANCGIHLVMKDVKNAISSVLETTTLADMIDRSEAECFRKSQIIDYSI